jgi:ferredoxin-like protein FixX
MIVTCLDCGYASRVAASEITDIEWRCPLCDGEMQP